MPIRDLLASEDSDARGAASAASQGRSITGFSGRLSDVGDRFSRGDEAFGPRLDVPKPLVGEPAERIRPSGQEGEAPSGPRRAIEMPVNRKPFGAQEQVLDYPARAGYRRYWFNDVPGRIIRAKEAGYSHVIDSDTSQPVARITDQANGRGRSSYLMEIPIEWYQQDMARQAAELELRLSAIKNGQAGPGAEDNRYIPQQGIRITGR